MKAGKSFIRELATLYHAYVDATALECVTLKACSVMLLLKPHAKSKAKEHTVHLDLERRLKLWQDGNIEVLIHDGASRST